MARMWFHSSHNLDSHQDAKLELVAFHFSVCTILAFFPGGLIYE